MGGGGGGGSLRVCLLAFLVGALHRNLDGARLLSWFSSYLSDIHAQTGHAAFQPSSRTVASSLEPYCVVITTTPTFAYSLVQVPNKMWYSHGRT